MELRHLRYFVTVAEELHFQRAAKRLHIEQSPLSRAIKDLETDLGVRLLERTTRCTTMTKAGKLFLAEARRILASVEQARSAIKSVSLGYSQQLRIAITEGVPQHRIQQSDRETATAECRAGCPTLRDVSCNTARGLDQSGDRSRTGIACSRKPQN